jgi:hypothetical protein
MKLPQTGGCQCGKVRYEITEEPWAVYTCHCLECQRPTGSAFVGDRCSRERVAPDGVEPRRLNAPPIAGARLVCPECGSWISGKPRDGVVRGRGGTLDDTSWVRPTRHIWVRRKQPWVMLPQGDEVFEGLPAG